MKKIKNGLANVTVFCLLLSMVITSEIVATCGFQIITAPDGSIGNNFIRNVTSIVAQSKKLAVTVITPTIGRRG